VGKQTGVRFSLLLVLVMQKHRLGASLFADHDYQ
jgi:hypothetical protein